MADLTEAIWKLWIFCFSWHSNHLLSWYKNNSQRTSVLLLWLPEDDTIFFGYTTVIFGTVVFCRPGAPTSGRFLLSTTTFTWQISSFISIVQRHFPNILYSTTIRVFVIFMAFFRYKYSIFRNYIHIKNLTEICNVLWKTRTMFGYLNF